MLTGSIFVKKEEVEYVDIQLYNSTDGNFGRVVFDLDLGIIHNTLGGVGHIQEINNGWYRCSVTATATATNSYIVIVLHNGTTSYYTGDGSSGLYVWGAQLEESAGVTSHIPTTTTAVTRAADIISSTATTRNADLFEIQYVGNSPGPLFAKSVVFDVDIIGTNSANSKLFDSGDLQLLDSSTVANDGETFAYMDVGSETAKVSKSGNFRMGVTYDPDNTTLIMYHDGVNVAEDASATTSAARGDWVILSSGDSYHHLKGLHIYNRVLSPSEMA